MPHKHRHRAFTPSPLRRRAKGSRRRHRPARLALRSCTGRRLALRPGRDRQRHRARRRAPPAARRDRLRRGQRRSLGARHADLARARERGPANGARAPPRPLRAPHVALAPLLLATEGRLDHLAADQRHRRALGRPQPGPDDARRQHADTDRRSLWALSARRAAWARGLLRAPTRDHCHSLVPARLARGGVRGADPDRDRHRPARRVGRRDGSRAGVQPRARVPGRVRRAQRAEPRRERPRAEDLFGLLSRDRATRGDRDRRR